MSTGRRQDNKFIVYTDIIGHTRMFGRVGAAFRAMRERHDALFMDAVRALAPTAVVKGTGDGFYAAFDDVAGALETALAFKYGLSTEDWMAFLPPEKKTPDNAIKCRIGVHTGLVNIAYQGDKPVDFDGQPRVITEKVMSSSAANQILITRPVRDQAMVNFSRREEVKVVKFGEYKFRDVADTVEVWGIADDEAGLGPKPAQAPEHRVIVFAVIDNHAALGETGGVQYTESKDLWDKAFDQTIAEHAQDAFVKRMPEGTLAAFRTAIEATRVARDFRRALKVALAQMPVKLAPRIGVDSGLVTFEYSDNRPSDVRDQPVNVAAKIAKVDKPILCNPWQTILTRPVREDAYANLKERDDAKWVCLGRKSVPGEPEPIELWDFQDSLTKSDSRTVLWVDARGIRKAAGDSSDAWRQFRARLAALVEETLGARAEKPWIIPTDTGMAAAFSNHVEAVAAADDLRKAALLEPWERFPTGYRRAGREDNLLGLSLAMGPLRVHYEDGQIKDLKGEAVDAVKAVAELARHGQVLLSRDLMDSVATAFPETDVKWRRVEAEGKQAAEAYEFVRVTKKAGGTRGILVGSGIAAVAVVAAVVGVIYFGGPRTVQRTAGDVRPLVAGLETFNPDDTGRALIAKLTDLYNQRDLDLQRQEMPILERTKQIQAELKPYESLLQSWAVRFDSRATDAARPSLEAVKDVESLNSWVAGLSRFEKLPGGNPIGAQRQRWLTAIEQMGYNLTSAQQGEGELAKKLADIRLRIDAGLQKPWVAANREAIEAEVKAIDAEIGPTGTLAAAVEDVFTKWSSANKDAFEAQMRERIKKSGATSGLPEEILTPILTAASGPAPLLRQAGARADALTQSLAGSTVEKQAAVKPLADALARLTKDFRQYDFAAAATSLGKPIDEAATPAALVEALGKLEEFRRLENDPRRDVEWGEELAGIRQRLIRERVPAESARAVEEQLKAVEERITTLRAVPATAANLQTLTTGAAAISAELAPASPLLKAADAAIAEAGKAREQQLRRDQEQGEVKAELDRILGQATVPGADHPALDQLWKRVRADLQAAAGTGSPVEVRDQARAWQTAIAAVPAKVPAATVPGTSRIARALGSAAQTARDGVLNEIASGAKTGDPTALVPAAETAGKAFEATLANYVRLAASASAIEQALNQATLLDEPAGEGATLAQRSAEFEKDPLLATPAVSAAAADLRARTGALAEIAKLDSAAALLAKAQASSNATPEIYRAVWTRLGSVGGADQPGWLTAQLELLNKIAGLVSPVTPERIQAIQAGVANDSPARWLKHVDSTSDAAALARARSEQARFRVTGDMFAKLSSAARYNLASLGLRDAANANKPEDELKALAKTVVEFGRKAGDPAVVEAVNKIQDALDGKGVEIVASGELPLAEAGPAQAGWELLRNEGGSVTYRMKPPSGRKLYPDQPPPEITFHRVGAAASGSGSTYVAATALSLGHAFAIIDSVRGAWKTAESLISRKPAEQMVSPGAWRAGRDRFEIGLRDVKGQPSWLTAGAADDAALQYFPPGLAVPPPSPAMPMQYVSPRLAVYLARLVGCRLPAPAEWQAALQADGGLNADLAAYNLRDQAVLPVLERIALNQGPKSIGFQRIDATVFPSRPANQTAVYPSNDGVVLFAPVDQPVRASGKFAHLVGNVGQWVVDDPDRLNDLKIGDASGFVDSNEAAFAVVGGSALAEVRDPKKLTEPVRLTPAQLKVNADRGYSDVGVRLAFSTSRPVAAAASERTLADTLTALAKDLPLAKPAPQ